MTVSEIISWLSAAPQLNGEPLNLDFLPSYSGWSLTVMKSSVKTDILGNAVRSYTLKITRRHTVQNNTDRLAILSSLEDLAAWAKENPHPVLKSKYLVYQNSCHAIQAEWKIFRYLLH